MSENDGKCHYPHWCKGLESLLEVHREGLIQLNIFNMNTNQITVLGVAYKAKATDKGVLLNYCPICGENIKPR